MAIAGSLLEYRSTSSKLDILDKRRLANNNKDSVSVIFCALKYLCSERRLIVNDYTRSTFKV